MAVASRPGPLALGPPQPRRLTPPAAAAKRSAARGDEGSHHAASPATAAAAGTLASAVGAAPARWLPLGGRGGKEAARGGSAPGFT